MIRGHKKSDYYVRVGAAAVNLEANDAMVIAADIVPTWAHGQERELRCTAVVVEKPGSGRIAIVACDVIFIPSEIVDPALAEIERDTGIPASHILVNATHTHHAPSVACVHGYCGEPDFIESLRKGIVESVKQANKQLPDGDATFLFHLGEQESVGENSRLYLDDDEQIYWTGPRSGPESPTGPFDPELPVFGFRSPDGHWRAILYNHSTHTIGTIGITDPVTSEVNYEVRSPSFYGLAAQELEEELGAHVSFLEGASGSTHIILIKDGLEYVVAVTPSSARFRMKKAVRDALPLARVQPLYRFASQKRIFTFNVRTFDEQEEDGKVRRYCGEEAVYIADDKRNDYIQVFKDMRAELSLDQGQQRETWLQAIALGDVALVGVPGELFASLGCEIKERSPFKYTVIAELANDWVGYLPDCDAYRLGGYQTWMGLHSYVEIGTGERMRDEVIRMLEELAQ